jgi:hypothetical protein
MTVSLSEEAPAAGFELAAGTAEGFELAAGAALATATEAGALATGDWLLTVTGDELAGPAAPPQAATATPRLSVNRTDPRTLLRCAGLDFAILHLRTTAVQVALAV